MFTRTAGMRCNVVSYQDPDATISLFNATLARGQWGLIWAKLTRRSRALLSLDDFLQGCTVQVGSSAEKRMVTIAQIDGSENRFADFDRNFNPLQDRTRDRWLGIARSRQQGRYLPPVTLIQVGNHYFVRDGHHRISVARAFRDTVIHASVIVWNVIGNSGNLQEASCPSCP